MFVLGSHVACAGRIDRFTVDRVLTTGARVADPQKACALGSSLAVPLDAIGRGRAHLALAIAEGTAALCAEEQAWEADLDALRARTNAAGTDVARAAEIVDASIRAERAHAVAAARFDRAFAATEGEWGTVGGPECPRIADRDAFVYLFGLVSGTLALLHDRASGGVNGIPLDRLSAVARGAPCLDDTPWWSAPTALQAGAWATVPGLAPAGTDPWQQLAAAADAGDASGVRVARAIQILIAANAGRDDVLRDALAAHAAARAEAPTDPDWALLDAYALRIALHESDRVWTAATGHRTERFGRWPGVTDATELPTGPDPFAEDPFASPDPVSVENLP